MFAIPAAVKAIAETKAAQIPEPLKVYREAIIAAPIPDDEWSQITCSFACTLIASADYPGELQLTDRMK